LEESLYDKQNQLKRLKLRIYNMRKNGEIEVPIYFYKRFGAFSLSDEWNYKAVWYWGFCSPVTLKGEHVPGYDYKSDLGYLDMWGLYDTIVRSMQNQLGVDNVYVTDRCGSCFIDVPFKTTKSQDFLSQVFKKALTDVIVEGYNINEIVIVGPK